ncbi:hypothetical protein D3C85_1485930 [compost metagenome]
MKGLTKVPEAGEVYLHHKGLAYEVLCLAKDQDREELLVIHKGSDGQIWSRTIGNFMAYAADGLPRFQFLKPGADDTPPVEPLRSKRVQLAQFNNLHVDLPEGFVMSGDSLSNGILRLLRTE